MINNKSFTQHINFQFFKTKTRKHSGSCITGFTLIEVLIAIFLLTVGTVGAIHAIVRVIEVTEISSSQLIASYLAQEGIEIIRNFRDGNWLEQRTNPTLSWTDGLSVGDWEADYNDSALSSYGAGRYLKIDGGFYNYEPGTDTKFKRKITIEKPADDTLKVTVWVGWTERGKSFSVTSQENLYNWLKR